MQRRTFVALMGGAACSVVAGPSFASDAEPLGPRVDHHQHLLSPAVAAMIAPPAPTIALPDDVRALLEQRTAAWNAPAQLAPLYAENAVVVDDRTVVGRQAVSEHVGTRFGRPYAITPTAYSDFATTRQIAAIYTRGDGAQRTNVGATLITLVCSSDGAWLIASETMRFPGPDSIARIDANRLVAMLDEASIERAVVLSIAYLLDSPRRPETRDAAALRAENDWTAAEVARHPSRLIGFCSVNPLTPSAIAEIERCKRRLNAHGLKLHFANSRVDVSNADHLAQIQRLFARANALRLPIVAHLWTGDAYGSRETEIFLNQILPHAPDVVVQIAHMAGAGPGWTDEALDVLARAVEASDPRTRQLYFDLATVATSQSADQLNLLARRIRQIGPSRILYGSDGSFGGNAAPNQSWGNFRGMTPLTDAEFAIIRDNVAPYLR